jgi:hypothetical protein
VPSLAATVEAIWARYSGDRAWSLDAALSLVRRPVGTAGAARCLTLCADALGPGFPAERLRFPVNGESRYGPHGPSGVWTPRAGRLRVVEPEERLIADFDREPMVLAALSRSVDSVCELFDAGPGDRPEHYEGRDVAGKIVLADGMYREVARLAVERFGAAGVALAGIYRESGDPTVRRNRYDLPDAIVSAGLNPEDPANPKGFGFSLSYRQADELRGLLRKGPVKLHAQVDADFGPGEMEALTATIPGGDLAAEEVWVIAHIVEGHSLMVGANDNCSGSASGVEIFRALQGAIAAGALPAPRRTLRLLLVPEISGTHAYVEADPARIRRCVGGVNLDMVGADHAVTHAITNLVCTPWSVPSCMNDVGLHILGLVADRGRLHQGDIAIPNFTYTATPFASASDHAVLVDGAYSTPCVFFFEWPDRFYHTNLDTPDKVSPDTLRRTGTAAAALAYAFAAADGAAVRELVGVADSGARRRMAQAVAEGLAAVGTAPECAGEWAERLSVMGEVGRDTLVSALALLPEREAAEVRPLVERRAAALLAAAAAERERLLDTAGAAPSVAQAHADAGRRPRRLYAGSFPRRDVSARIPAWDERERAAGRQDPRHGQKTFELLNLCDGEHELGAICRLVQAEFGPFSVADAVAHLGPLAEHGFVAW